MKKKNYPIRVVEAAERQGVDLDAGNLIVPSENFGHDIGQYDKVVIEVIRINPELSEGEVYLQGKEYVFTGRTLQNISNLIGIMWDPKYTGLIHSVGSERVGKAVGAVRNSHGDWVPVTASKTINIDAYEDEMIDKYTEEADKGDCRKDYNGHFISVDKWEETSQGKKYPVFKPWPNESTKEKWINKCVRKAVIRYREFANEKAETGAVLRAIRKLYPFKSTYRKEELLKPFYLPRVTIDNDKVMSSPELRQMSLNRALGVRNFVFGVPGRSLIEKSQNQEPRVVGSSEVKHEEQESQEEQEAKTVNIPEDPVFEDDKITDLKVTLEEYLNTYKFSDNVVKNIQGFIADKEITESALRGHIKTIEKFIEENSKS